MKRMWGYVALIAAAMLLIGTAPAWAKWVARKWTQSTRDAAEIARLKVERDVLRANYAEAVTRMVIRIDTVRIQADGVLTLAPLVIAHPENRPLVLQFTQRAASEARSCLALANDCEAVRHRADSLLAKTDTLNQKLEANQPRFIDRFGVTVGYGPTFTKSDSGRIATRLGWNVSASFRVWPRR